MQIVLFEDHLTGENRPATLARPAFAIGLAATRLHDVAVANASSVGMVVRDYLRAKTEADFAPAPIAEGDVLFLNASLAPSIETIERLTAEAGKGEDFLIQQGSRVAAAWLKAVPKEAGQQDVNTITSFLLGQKYRAVRDEMPLIELPCDIVRYHQKFFDANIARLTGGCTESAPGVFTGEGVVIHETAVLDAEEGPIVLADGVSIGPFAYVIGPAIIGRGTRVIERASIKEQVQIGHTCKIGGEVECAVVEPWSNKQHHGFLGHGYVGSWVNMGAGTSNSDLKNTYGEVTIVHGGRRVETGLQFLGCIIGDFAKTAINTSIFTGKTVGVSSYLYGFVGDNVPSFTNYARSFGQVTEYLLDAAVRTQGRMFARRKVAQTPADIKLLEDIYELTRDERLMSADPLRF